MSSFENTAPNDFAGCTFFDVHDEQPDMIQEDLNTAASSDVESVDSKSSKMPNGRKVRVFPIVPSELEPEDAHNPATQISQFNLLPSGVIVCDFSRKTEVIVKPNNLLIGYIAPTLTWKVVNIRFEHTRKCTMLVIQLLLPLSDLENRAVDASLTNDSGQLILVPTEVFKTIYCTHVFNWEITTLDNEACPDKTARHILVESVENSLCAARAIYRSAVVANKPNQYVKGVQLCANFEKKYNAKMFAFYLEKIDAPILPELRPRQKRAACATLGAVPGIIIENMDSCNVSFESNSAEPRKRLHEVGFEEMAKKSMKILDELCGSDENTKKLCTKLLRHVSPFDNVQERIDAFQFAAIALKSAFK